MCFLRRLQSSVPVILLLISFYSLAVHHCTIWNTSNTDLVAVRKIVSWSMHIHCRHKFISELVDRDTPYSTPYIHAVTRRTDGNLERSSERAWLLYATSGSSINLSAVSTGTGRVSGEWSIVVIPGHLARWVVVILLACYC